MASITAQRDSLMTHTTEISPQLTSRFFSRSALKIRPHLSKKRGPRFNKTFDFLDFSSFFSQFLMQRDAQTHSDTSAIFKKAAIFRALTKNTSSSATEKTPRFRASNEKDLAFSQQRECRVLTRAAKKNLLHRATKNADFFRNITKTKPFSEKTQEKFRADLNIISANSATHSHQRASVRHGRHERFRADLNICAPILLKYASSPAVLHDNQRGARVHQPSDSARAALVAPSL